MDEGVEGREMFWLLKPKLIFEVIKDCFNQAALTQDSLFQVHS